MAFFNYVTKEITLKVVYYGPGLSGKTTNLQYLYSLLDSSSRGKFISLATEADRTLFFDFLPVELGRIRDFSVRFQLYTVPGQTRYDATRKLVLKGADAVVFVADSQRDMREQNRESFENMRENLLSNNIDPDEIPVVLQFNKRDLPNILSREELHDDLNRRNYEEIEAIAVKGERVEETFRLISRILLKDLARKHKVDVAPPRETAAPAIPPQKEREQIVDAILPQTPSFQERERVMPQESFTPAERDAAPPREVPAPVIFPEEEREDIVDAILPQTPSFQERERILPQESFPPPRTEAPHPAPMIFPEEEREDIVEKVIPQKAFYERRETAIAPQPAPSPEKPALDERFTSAVTVGLIEIKQSIAAIRDSLKFLSTEIKESERQQADIAKMLRELNNSLEREKRKKRWFHFS